MVVKICLSSLLTTCIYKFYLYSRITLSHTHIHTECNHISCIQKIKGQVFYFAEVSYQQFSDEFGSGDDKYHFMYYDW